MGAYLTRPKTEKYSSDETNETIICGSSSMQGWRQTQEDAHNSILDFDNGASFFAVYDGHGGNEVAEYTAQHLPTFLKSLDSYKSGNYEEALKEAFLKFDATLKEPEVVSVLKEISKSGNNNADTTDSEDENLGSLTEEAQMPLHEVMAKYKAKRECLVNSNVNALMKDGNKMPISPYLRGKGSESSIENMVNCSGKSDMEQCSNSSQVTNFQDADAEVSSSSSSSKCISQRNSLSEKYRNGKAEIAGRSGLSNEDQVNGSMCEGETSVSDSLGDKVNVKSDKVEEASVQLPDSSADLNKTEDAVVNGSEEGSGDAKMEETISSSVENGEVRDTDKGKGKGKGKQLVKVQGKVKKKGGMSAQQIFEGFIKQDQNEEYSESDSDDATFHGPDSTSDDDDEAESGRKGNNLEDSEECDEEYGDEDDEEDDEDDDDDEDEDDEEDDDDEDEFTMNMTDELKQYLTNDGSVRSNFGSSVDFLCCEDGNDVGGRDRDEDDDDEDEDDCCEESEEFGKNFLINILKRRVPGFDSGCTAVVALLVNNKIYVANAGDSRCIVSRKGEVIEMSLDHKPEDKQEMDRIEKAGGRVTCDGRVNGGLNLSRALGDHSYKRVEELPPDEQMISPLPDIKVLDVDPDVEFMILACDGIWNFMSSQDVLNFVRARLLKSPEKVSQVCEELFDHCLAPDTLGDGTGCDNMTAVLVQFKHSTLLSSSKKRGAEDVTEENCKRQKTEDATSTESPDSVKCDSSEGQREPGMAADTTD